MISVYSYGVDSGVSNNAPVETINKINIDSTKNPGFVGFDDILNELHYSTKKPTVESNSQFIPLYQVTKKVHLIKNKNTENQGETKKVTIENQVNYEKQLVNNDIKSILKHLNFISEQKTNRNSEKSTTVNINEKDKFLNSTIHAQGTEVKKFVWSSLEQVVAKEKANSEQNNKTNKSEKVLQINNENKIIDKIHQALNKIIPDFDESKLNIKSLQVLTNSNETLTNTGTKNIQNALAGSIDAKKKIDNSKSEKANLSSFSEESKKVSKNSNDIKYVAEKNNDNENSNKSKSNSIENSSIFQQKLEEKFDNISRLNNSSKQNADKIQLNKEVSTVEEKIVIRSNKNDLVLNSNSTKESITGNNHLKHEISDTYNFSTFSKIEELADRAVQMIKSQPINTVQTVRILLQPESLGTLFVKIELSQGAVNLKIEAESKETVKNIESQIFLLKEKLTQQGLKIENIELGVRNNDEYANQQDSHKREPKEDNKKLMKDFLSSFKFENEFIEQNVL